MNVWKYFPLLLSLILLFVAYTIIVLFPITSIMFSEQTFRIYSFEIREVLFQFIQTGEKLLNKPRYFSIDKINLWERNLTSLQEKINGLTSQFTHPPKNFLVSDAIVVLDASWETLYNHFTKTIHQAKSLVSSQDHVKSLEFSLQKLYQQPDIDTFRKLYNIYNAISVGNRLLQQLGNTQLTDTENVMLGNMNNLIRTILQIHILILITLGGGIITLLIQYQKKLRAYLRAETHILSSTDYYKTNFQDSEDFPSMLRRTKLLSSQYKNLKNYILIFMQEIHESCHTMTEEKNKRQDIMKSIQFTISHTEELSQIAQCIPERINHLKKMFLNTITSFLYAISQWDIVKIRILSLTSDIKKEIMTSNNLHTHIENDDLQGMLLLSQEARIVDLRQKILLSLQKIENLYQLIDEIHTFSDRTIVLSMNITMTHAQKNVNEKVITNISGEVRKLGSEIMDTLKNFHGTLKNLTLHLQSSHNMLKNELKNMEAFYTNMNNKQELFTSVQLFINTMKITYNEFHSCVETVNTFFDVLTKQLQDLPQEFATVFEDVSIKFQEFASSTYDTENITQLLKEWYSSEQVLQDVMANIAERMKTLENKVHLCQ